MMQEVQVKLSGLAKTAAIEGDIVVGKDVLELVAGAMYADPLTVYREYVQNSADAVDAARALTLKLPEDAPHVRIELDHSERTVKIRDLGAGVSNAEFTKKLTAIGASSKRGTKQRGFRGVGRLSGLGYCQELIFRSRAAGDSKIKELSWDGRTLREKLRDNNYTESLTDLIRAVTKVTTLPDDGSYPAHFFEVEMRRIIRIKNDLLMNEEEIRFYLAQVAPVPFRPDFKFGDQISDWLQKQGLSEPLRIELNDDQGLIYHRATSQAPLSKQVMLSFNGVEFRTLANTAGETLGFAWILEHGYLGAMPRGSNLGGLRLRMRDVQVGDAQTLAPLFAEQRFSSWAVGEIHVAHPKIIPNARRDEFEHSAAYAELQDELRRLASEITHRIRSRSIERQASKRLALAIAYTEGWIDIAQRDSLHTTIRRAALEQAREHLKSIDKQIAKTDPGAEVLRTADRLRLQVRRLSDNFEKNKTSVARTPATTKSALAAVSAILSSTVHTQKAIPMAERVIAAMEGIKEKV